MLLRKGCSHPCAHTALLGNVNLGVGVGKLSGPVSDSHLLLFAALFGCCDQTLNKDSLREEKDTGLTHYNPSSGDAQAGWSRQQRGIAALPPALSVAGSPPFLYSPALPRLTCLGEALPTTGCGPTYLNQHPRKSPTDMPTGQSDGDNSSTEVPYSQIHLCQADKRLPAQGP